jgi:beta-galactosidase
MSTGYEAGGYGMIELDGALTARSRAAGRTASVVHANAELLLATRPAPAEVAVIFNPLVPLLGGEQAYGDRRNVHRAVAGYHRMFFERNVPVEFPSAREITAETLRRFKLVILPTPLLLTEQMAGALEQYVREGGHLLTEARPGWQDERGHAQPVLPGFGWHRMLGVRETELRPVKQARIDWGGKSFTGVVFAERFAPVEGLGDPRVLARYEDGEAAAVEREHGKGAAIILGTFAGEANQLEPQAMHPLADALIDWAGVSRSPLRSSSFVEVRRMVSGLGEIVMFFNHGAAEATVTGSLALARPAGTVRELVTGTALGAAGSALPLDIRMPAESVRVYRVDY